VKKSFIHFTKKVIDKSYWGPKTTGETFQEKKRVGHARKEKGKGRLPGEPFLLTIRGGREKSRTTPSDSGKEKRKRIPVSKRRFGVLKLTRVEGQNDRRRVN